MRYYSGGPYRTVCECLEEIRTIDKTKNYSSLLSLVEEVQTLANRMEAKLYEVKDWERTSSYYKQLKKKIKQLEKEHNLDEED